MVVVAVQNIAQREDFRLRGVSVADSDEIGVVGMRLGERVERCRSARADDVAD